MAGRRDKRWKLLGFQDEDFAVVHNSVSAVDIL
jgi:hypothetical protein